MLRFRADLRPLAFNALYFGLLLVGMFTDAPLWSPLTVVLVGLLCLTAFQGAVQTHNAVHSPVFKARWANKVYQVLLTLTYGHPVSAYVPGHNLSHHKFVQSRKDLMRTSKARFRYNLFNLLFFFAAVTPGIMKADGRFTKLMKKSHRRWYIQSVIEMVVLQACSLAFLLIDWRRAIVFWFIPHVYAAWGIVTINLIQHDGCDESHAYNHSRNFVGRWVNWFAFNNGFHGIHHMRPGLHWSLTPAAHAKELAPHVHANLDQASLLAYVWRTYILNQRTDYLGNKLVLPEAGPDEDWMPRLKESRDELGAEALEAGDGGMADAVAHRTVTT